MSESLPVKIAPISPENRFRLDSQFLDNFRGKQPAFGPLGLVVFKRTYARPVSGQGRTEEFWETLQRVTEDVYSRQKQHMRATGQRWLPSIAQRHAQEFYQRMWDGKFLPSGRMLWFLGTEALEIKGGAALFNCGLVSTQNIAQDFARPFTWMMDFSMLGCGVGFDTRGAGTVVIKDPPVSTAVYAIPDSREGWVEALETVLRAFSEGTPLPASFDYSELRPEGAPITTFGGTSSGPEPLRRLLNDTMVHLFSRVGQPISSTDIVDLMNRIGVCVVSGNVRRSSQLALGDPSDASFVELKDPVLHPKELTSHRWASNNTVLADGIVDFTKLAKQSATNGEPGYFWLQNARRQGRMADPPDDHDARVMGTNPCAEIVLESEELCNVPETFPGRHDSLEDWLRTLKYAYVLGKTVSLIPTHDHVTNSVITRNRRLGISMAGITSMHASLGMRECVRWWDAGYQFLRDLDKEYSRWMGINRSIRLTSVKPGGSVPLLFGVEGGMKFPSANRYYRTMRIDHLNPLVEILKASGYRIEHDIYAPRTVVVYFPVAIDGHCRRDEQVSIWEKVSLLAALQAHWADNSVSNTITFRSDEASEIPRILDVYADKLKTISFLPIQDHGYAQAPYQAITEQQYLDAVAQLKPLDLSASQHEAAAEDKYCSGDRCSIPTVAA